MAIFRSKRLIYSLSKLYGSQRNVLYLKHLSQTTSPVTGKINTSSVGYPIKICIILPKNKDRRAEFARLIPEFRYDSTWDRLRTIIVFDKMYIPKDIHIEQEDRFLINKKQWGVNDVQLYEEIYTVSLVTLNESEPLWNLNADE